MIKCQNVWIEFTRRFYREKSLKDFVLRNLEGAGTSSKFWALKDIGFEVPRGHIMGIIGSNGSGKSTLLKILGGLLTPDRGQIHIQGRVAPLLELGVGFEASLSGAENIFFNGAVLKMKKQDIRKQFDSIVDFAELHEVIDSPLIHYSTGMMMRLGFAIAIHGPADILLIDEILAVGDAAFQAKCLNKIHEINSRGVSIVFVSHSMELVKSLCKSALWIHHGAAASQGEDIDRVIQDYRLGTDDNLRRIHEEAERATQEALARKAREVEILDFAFLNAEGQPVNKYKTFGSMVVKLFFNAKARVENPIFGLAIHHKEGVHICGPNTQECGYPVAHLQGRGEIELEISQLNMVPGEYVVSAAIWNSTHTTAYDWAEKAYPFAVEPADNYKHRGCVAMNYRWKIPK
ncbi:MAG: ABC transporter ATP-binding protein [Nitrospinae bacterium]|nr:ABC transporter ATP-binding protein [Nitrospinota bacterium]